MFQEELLLQFQNCFTKPSYNSFEIYTKGLLSEIRNFSVLSLSELFGVSDDRCEYFISRAKWDEKKMNRLRIGYHLRASYTNKWSLLIDDTSIRKFTDNLFFVAKGYIGNLGKVDNCMTGVLSVLSNGKEKIPLDILPYISSSKLFGGVKDREFLSKIDIASRLVNQTCFLAGELGIEIAYILFDIWYSAGWFLNLLNLGQLYYVCEIRSNRVVQGIDGKRLSVKSFVTAINSESKKVIYANKDKYEIETSIVRIPKLDHRVKLFCVRGKFCGKRKVRYFISNDLDLAEEEALVQIRRRWDIDHLIRESKTYLAFDEGKF